MENKNVTSYISLAKEGIIRDSLTNNGKRYTDKDSLYSRVISYIILKSNYYNEFIAFVSFLLIIDEFIEKGFIKIENGQLLYCNPSKTVNPQQIYVHVKLGLDRPFFDLLANEKEKN